MEEIGKALGRHKGSKATSRLLHAIQMALILTDWSTEYGVRDGVPTLARLFAWGFQVPTCLPRGT